uniref:Putative cell wall protein awa1 n=1 Tax=Panstrongylus lignarius TaxID=156445 RepID=A0A224XUH8_9HEMI
MISAVFCALASASLNSAITLESAKGKSSKDSLVLPSFDSSAAGFSSAGASPPSGASPSSAGGAASAGASSAAGGAASSAAGSSFGFSSSISASLFSPCVDINASINVSSQVGIVGNLPLFSVKDSHILSTCSMNSSVTLGSTGTPLSSLSGLTISRYSPVTPRNFLLTLTFFLVAACL